MTLEPCTQCRRHIAADAAVCPFCAAPRSVASRVASIAAGRFSRAAVFAGLAGCYTSNPPPQYPPPPPPPGDQQPPPPPDQQPPPPDQRFAQPPFATGTIRGVVSDASSGAPLANFHVELSAPGLGPLATRTDASGRYAFTNLAANEYTLLFGPEVHQQFPHRAVQLPDRGTAVIDQAITVRAPIINHSNVPKPYGAPPWRRRVV